MLNEEKILEVLREQKVSAVSLEEGAGLVDHWISQCAELDARDRTLAVEAGFFIELPGSTFVVGTQDRIAQSHVTGEVFGCEWKSTKHQTKLWTPEAWYESISNGHQVATYALGLKFGQVIGEDVIGTVPLREGETMFPGDGSVNILVRAVSKSHPPAIWPDPEGKFVNISSGRMEAMRGAYRNVADSIRAQRKNQGPWQVPGLQCTNMFRSVCPFLSSCKKFESFSTEQSLTSITQSFSPGSKKVVRYLIDSGRINEGNLGEVVVLSASTLGTYQQCSEKWRREAASGEEEENENLDIGTVLHAGLSELYSQQMQDRIELEQQ
jgi:hypothetical protein